MDGELRPCCRNRTSYGNYVQIGLKEAWQSTVAQKFREKIALGKYPDDECRACHQNGTAASIERDVWGALQRCLHTLDGFLQSAGHPQLPKSLVNDSLKLCQSTRQDEQTKATLVRLRDLSAYVTPLLIAEAESIVKAAQRKLESICRTIEDFLHGEVQPRSVAPHRQVQLVAICNARCFHCPGLFNLDIVRGFPVEGGFKKRMTARDVDIALEYGDDLTDFFCNGSEFLMYPQWKEIANRLYDSLVPFAVSTNGILLTKDAVDFLFSKPYLSHLNVSMDGAERGTVERIRVNVSFDRLVSHVQYLFAVAAKADMSVHVGVSFVIMKQNFRELPKLALLLDELRGQNKELKLSLLIQSFDSLMFPEYKALLRTEHISQVEASEVLGILRETESLASTRNIHTRAFYSWSLSDFLSQGLPLPQNPG